jgi:hypothetical protein
MPYYWNLGFNFFKRLHKHKFVDGVCRCGELELEKVDQKSVSKLTTSMVIRLTTDHPIWNG